jgi:hypothetical protein
MTEEQPGVGPQVSNTTARQIQRELTPRLRQPRQWRAMAIAGGFARVVAEISGWAAAVSGAAGSGSLVIMAPSGLSYWSWFSA